MSTYEDIMAALETRCKNSVGVKNVYRGEPEPLPTTPNQYPLVVLEAGAPVPTPLTFGDAGIQEMAYPATIRLLLGAADTKAAIAQARYLPLPDRFRATFMGIDRTLGGLCRDSAMTQPQENLTVYVSLKEEPEVRWRFVAMVDTTPATPGG